MFSVKVTQHFDAAHKLRDYIGKCARLHGHTFSYTVELRAPDLDPLGMLVDFIDVKSACEKKVNSILDHEYLNEKFPFEEINPTAENLAKYMYGRLKAQLPQLYKVTVEETPGNSASYWEEN